MPKASRSLGASEGLPGNQNFTKARESGTSLTTRLCVDHQRDARKAEVTVGGPAGPDAALVHQIKADRVGKRQILVGEAPQDRRGRVLLSRSDRTDR